MYCIFLDESGTSISNTHLVVAGVIIHGDMQWHPVATALSGLRDKYFPESQSKDSAFHATDLYHGSGPIFGRNKYPAEESFEALKEILAIPSKFKLPVSVGYIMKKDEAPTPARRRYSESYHHALAATLCLVMADGFLKEYSPDKLAWAIAEDNTVTRKTVKGVYDMVKKSSTAQMPGIGTPFFEYYFSEDELPLKKIVSGIHFVEKREEPLLQIADACAFAIRCFLQRKTRWMELWGALTAKQCKVAGMQQSEGGNGLMVFP